MLRLTFQHMMEFCPESSSPHAVCMLDCGHKACGWVMWIDPASYSCAQNRCWGRQDVYRWARCPPLSAAAMRAAGTPLPAPQLQDAVTGLAWEDFQVLRPCIHHPYFDSLENNCVLQLGAMLLLLAQPSCDSACAAAYVIRDVLPMKWAKLQRKTCMCSCSSLQVMRALRRNSSHDPLSMLQHSKQAL